MITIQELLFNRGLDRNAKIKLVRHKDSSCDLYEEYRTNYNWFFAYQRSQNNREFHDVDYIVSFIAEEGLSSRFIGVFQVSNGKENPSYNPEDLTAKKYIYDIHEVGGFEDLKERVIVKWHGGARNWWQWIKNEMEVISIHPGLHYKHFSGYFDFILNFDELKEFVENEYSDWKNALSVTKGIYLISDTNTGQLYVGSASGKNGIWGRWSYYVETNGHGDNKKLKELIDKEPEYANNFQFSILMTLPMIMKQEDVIKEEALYKKKLGTNTFGLNCN